MAVEKNIMHLVQRVLANSPELTSEDFKNLPNDFNPYNTEGNGVTELLEIYHSLSQKNQIALIDSARKCLSTEKNNSLV